ncbi:AlpA family phage regulatory protein [Escherichia coli]|nr:AlpA family phage regulatory protein [Escherichia coli]
METIRKILTRQEVKNILRIKADSSLQDMINAGKFPKGFKIGLRRVGWYEDEVLAWLKEREEEARGTDCVMV